MTRFSDEAIEHAGAYAARFDKAGLGREPSKRLAVVTCMDARIDVHRILGLREGDAHVIRNPGGVVTESEIRALAISQRMMGTEEIVLIHHTDCGMLGFDDEAFRRELGQESGERPDWPDASLRDLDQDMRDTIARVKASPFVPCTDGVRGFLYDVETGRLREVEP